MPRLLLALTFTGIVAAGLVAKEPNPAKWEKAIAKFETEDEAKKPQPGGIVFTGSSSIALWKDVDKYFPGQNVLNRGFGGSTLPDVNHYLDRTVLKHKPRTVVLFCGGNDLATLKRTPEQVHADFRTFAAKVHDKLPDAKVVYISIHLPPGRVKLGDETRKANALIAAECKKNPKLAFVDVYSSMLGPDGQPNPELYRDPLHPNAKAYAIWAEKLRPVLE